MKDYPFRLVDASRDGPLSERELLRNRPFGEQSISFAEEAELYVPGDELETAINTALAVGEPLLITGEPGTGKTQAAYFAARNLGLEPVIHFQVKSESTAGDLLYNFDTVRYFHDAHLRKGEEELNKADYVERRALWHALASDEPRILLIDEIDKAPRDFPNDLLLELDRMEFSVIETGETVSAPPELRPIVFITSNSERRLPEPFLRRCVYHHIRFNDLLLKQAVEKRRHYYANLGDDFLKLAVERFLALRSRNLRKRPATGELLVWLRVLAVAVGSDPDRLDRDLSELPHIGALLKDHQDIEELQASGRKS